MTDLNDAINNVTKHIHPATNAMAKLVPHMKLSVPQQLCPYLQKQHAPGNSSALSYAASVGATSSLIPSGSIGMAADSNLQVALPNNSYQYYNSNHFSNHRKPVVGS